MLDSSWSSRRNPCADPPGLSRRDSADLFYLVTFRLLFWPKSTKTLPLLAESSDNMECYLIKLLLTVINTLIKLLLWCLLQVVSVVDYLIHQPWCTCSLFSHSGQGSSRAPWSDITGRASYCSSLNCSVLLRWCFGSPPYDLVNQVAIAQRSVASLGLHDHSVDDTVLKIVYV